jgi:hypothetical protein
MSAEPEPADARKRAVEAVRRTGRDIALRKVLLVFGLEIARRVLKRVLRV